MIPVAAPTRVRARLADVAGSVTILHRGPHALYLDVDGWCVGVVGTAAAAVPCALRVAAPDLGTLATARVATVVDGTLHLDDVTLRIGRTVDVTVPPLGTDALSPLVELVETGVTRELPTHALSLLATGDPAAVDALVGLGGGLTPLGDDVLCGFLAIHRAAGIATPDLDRAVTAALGRTTLLSATLLDCALHGEVLPEFARLVRAIGRGDTRSTGDPLASGVLQRPRSQGTTRDVAVSHAAAELASVGHTSGAGMLHGAHLALYHLARTERRRCA